MPGAVRHIGAAGRVGPLAVLCLIVLTINPTGTQAGLFIEDFDTKTFCDTLLTTAWWDTDARQLKLYPFELDLVGGLEIYGAVRDVALSGDHAYLAVDEGGFHVVDISDPSSPVDVGSIQSITYASGLDVDGGHAYLAALTRFLVIDISDPAHLEITGGVDGLSEATGVAVCGDIAFVASGNAGLISVDIRDPTDPRLAGGVDTPGYASTVTLFGDYAYVTDGYHGIAVIDVSDPRVPVHINQIPCSYHPERICISGRLAYVAEISAELLVYSLVDPAAPTLVGACPLPGHAHDVDVDGNHAYVAVADNDMTGFYAVDVTDPATPRIVAETVPPGFPIGVITAGEHAFVNCHHGGLQVIRIADPVEPVPAGDLAEQWIVRDLAVDGDIGYMLTRVTSDDYFITVSLLDPKAPQVLGSVALDCSPVRFAFAGPYAYVTAGNDGLVVVEVRDPASPSVAGALDIDGTTLHIELAGDYAYLSVIRIVDTHLIVVDITDPHNPAQVAELVCESTPHDIARSGDYLFVPQYEDGELRWTNLVTIDIGDPLNPVPVGSAGMNGDLVEFVCVEGDVLCACFWTFLGQGGYGVQLLDISDPLNVQPLGRYQDGANHGEICIAGDIAYFGAADQFRLDVLDVSDPMSPALLHSLQTTFRNGHLDRAGDFLFCAGGVGGLNTLQVFDRLVEVNANVAQSSTLPTSGVDLYEIRLETIAQPTLAWEFSADGGAHWQSLPEDGSWQVLAYPGAEPLWRATLLYTEPGNPPSVDQLRLEWSSAPTVVPEPPLSNFALHQNAPNPFTPGTTIRFELPESGPVHLEIFDVSGRLVRTLVDSDFDAGRHSVDWRGRDDAGQLVGSGVYLVRLRAPGIERVRRVEVVR